MTEVSASIIATTQTQEISDGVVELYQLTTPSSDKPVLYFHAGLDESLQTITFRDSTSPYTLRTYEPMPLHLEKTKLEADGATNRPTLTIANVLSNFSTELGDFKFDDLIGYKITKRSTLESHLNSGTTGAAGAPPVEFPQVSYIIDRIASETNVTVTFELAVPFDLENIKLPRRVLLGKYCSWVYKGIEDNRGGGCSWTCQQKVRPSSSGSRKGSNYSAGDLVEETVFLTARDEYVLDNYYNTGITTYNPNTSYTQGQFVNRSGTTWMAKVGNQNERPDIDSRYWERVHFWKNWTNTLGTINVGDYLKRNNKLWICMIQHTASDAKAPDESSIYWNFGDICGKTLRSCSRRFNLDITGDKPVKFNNVTLPFGGFPGSEDKK